MKTPENSRSLKKSPKIKELINFDARHGNFVVGTDEAGRGPMAGPVVAGAVYFPELNAEVIEAVRFINDSKKLSPKVRKELSQQIKQVAVWSVAECSVEEIEKYNILQASLLAMKRACREVLSQIHVKKEESIILVDGNFVIPRYGVEQKAVKKGDSLSAAIAAASILAKVHRDEFMQKISADFPEYDWAQNKGYGTKKHIEAILKHGHCKWHRKTFLTKIHTKQQKLF